MDFGTFLLMQSPSARPSQEIYARGIEIAHITHFNGSFWFGDLEHPRVLRSMELFAREVMPAFR